MIEVYELREVAEALGIPKSRVKNWTIGRPFRIKPTVRLSRGKGTRNLYGREDIYVLALANQLSEDGLPPGVIRRVLKVYVDNKGKDQVTGLKISTRGAQVSVWTSDRADPEYHFFRARDEFPEPTAYYLIDVQPLWKQIEEVIGEDKSSRRG